MRYNFIFAAMIAAAASPLSVAWAAPKTQVKANALSNSTKEPVHFSVIVEGKGPDVILIPGLSTPRDVWQGTADQFKGRVRLHLLQVRGFGDAAGANADGPVLNPLVDELATYIRQNKLKNPSIIGHSMGGLMALMIGARYPKLPKKLMIVDALPYIGTLFDPKATVEKFAPRASTMREAIRAAPDEPASDHDQAAKIAATLSNSASAHQRIAGWVRKSDKRVSAQALYDDLTIDMRPELAKIVAPVTLLYAQDNNIMSAEQAKLTFIPQYEGTQKLKAIPITGSFHFIMLDQPEKFYAEAKAFLDK